MSGLSAQTSWESRFCVRARAVSGSQRRDRREKLWAWAAVLVLVLCWDAASRLDSFRHAPREVSSWGAGFSLTRDSAGEV